MSRAPVDVARWTLLTAEPLERAPVRTRESGVTASAWRLLATSAEGLGGIVLVDVSPSQSYYRGDGVFLGASQEELAAVWAALATPTDVPSFDLPQLG